MNFAYLAQLALLLICWTVLYEIVRYRALRGLGQRLRKSTHDYMRRHQIDLNRWKFASKAFIREELLADREITEMIIAEVHAKGLAIDDVQETVETYIEEIVPSFSPLSYYRLAFPVARAVLHLLYSVVVDRATMERQHSLRPKCKACTVYVMNHRSNADYVLVAYALAESVSISYAVGEWARVWPLEHLFKSFGSYFVRRNFRDPLYHKVLEKYVQLLSRQGVTQGIFIEGGLSRDGRFRDPKIGLLDYILQVRRELGIDHDLIFLPVGINFDRVLEDENLLAEARGAKEARGIGARLWSLGSVTVRLAKSAVVNAARALSGNISRYGYASAAFGDPVSLHAYVSERGLDLGALPAAERKAEVKKFADHLMTRIALVVPVTPVPLVATALLEMAGAADAAGGGGADGLVLGREALLARVRELRAEWEGRGARIVMGHEFEKLREVREKLDAERAVRTAELHDVEARMLDTDEARRTVRIALDVLGRRGLVREEEAGAGGASVRLLGGARTREILGYYANSLLPFAPAPPKAGAPQPLGAKAGP